MVFWVTFLRLSLDYLHTQLFYETMLELMSQITVTKMFVKSLLKSYICIMYNLFDNQNIMLFNTWLVMIVSFPVECYNIVHWPVGRQSRVYYFNTEFQEHFFFCQVEEDI